MKRALVFAAATAILIMILGGCSLIDGLGMGKPEPEKIENGTTIGNILNYGFAVQYQEDMIFVYVKGSVYEPGSFVRSNPETGDNSLVIAEGGLYMNVVGDELYYCRPDGIYKTPIEEPAPVRLIEDRAELLQISGSKMYYISDKVIKCTSTDGAAVDFSEIKNADCLNVYNDAIYYINMTNNYIEHADLSGGNIQSVYEHSVDMFYVIDDVIYFIDSADGHIKRISIDSDGLETVVPYPCSGFNVNRGGIYYTREVDGIRACCNADVDGAQENVITEFEDSEWHVACMWNDAAMVTKIEDLANLL